MGLLQRNNATNIDEEIPQDLLDNESVFPMVNLQENSSDSLNQEAGHYSVGELIKLFHSLPRQNLDAEISAVVRTIASFDLNISDLINDLASQETLAKKRLKVLELEIELFEAKIKNRKREMDLLHVGLAEMGKSKGYLKKGLQRINEEKNTQRKNKKRKARLENIPELNNPIPIAEKIKIATSQEIDQINSASEVKSIGSKLRSRFFRFNVVSLVALLMISF